MPPNAPDDPEAAEDLAEQEHVKEAEVLQREGLEQELMEDDRSQVGEEITDVEESSEE